MLQLSMSGRKGIRQESFAWGIVDGDIQVHTLPRCSFEFLLEFLELVRIDVADGTEGEPLI